MIALPPPTTFRSDLRALLAMLCLVVVVFFSGGVSAFSHGDREFTQGQRTDAGQAGHIKAAFREALLLTQRLSHAETSDPDVFDDLLTPLLRLLSAWPASGFSAMHFHVAHTAKDLPNAAIATIPCQPQAPPR
ncbi:hypothetical protein [Allohahella marinimesophila]|uniref:Uncharacterized protein n=1 Tax=Allohahella marinimesophila TaxID=1054972 RepID=A0ABP7NW67_9GAMM